MQKVHTSLARPLDLDRSIPRPNRLGQGHTVEEEGTMGRSPRVFGAGGPFVRFAPLQHRACPSPDPSLPLHHASSCSIPQPPAPGRARSFYPAHRQADARAVGRRPSFLDVRDERAGCPASSNKETTPIRPYYFNVGGVCGRCGSWAQGLRARTEQAGRQAEVAQREDSGCPFCGRRWSVWPLGTRPAGWALLPRQFLHGARL